MERTSFQWQRFWCSPKGRMVLGDDGFLTDPESDWGHILNPDVQPVDLLTNVPCIALLGEPGSGKSTTLESERIAIESQLSAAGQEALWLDLHEIGSDAQLWRWLFDAPKFTDWKRSDRTLHLFLDSLDECRLQVNSIPTLLVKEFRQCPVERLRLRIACRTADWPLSLEQGLRELWGDDAVQVFELAPLRRQDVKLAASTAAIDPDAFISTIRQADAVPLAIKPLTLDFLIRTFRLYGTLPSGPADLYTKGCRLLCTESSKRRELRLPKLLDEDQRLAVAGRIAALTVFSNRAAIMSGVRRDDLPDGDITISELSGGTEGANGDSFRVNERGIEETLNTGLFSSRGESRLGWAHYTYSEFLAARYVVEHKLSLPQIMSLLVHPADPEGKLVPQLHETAAWLAGMRTDVFREILKREPDLLLRSDVGNASDDDRADLVLHLLQACEAEKWVDRDWSLRERYSKLRHPALANQLRIYITNSTKGATVRRVAIDIAEACEVRELLNDLVAVALDSDTPVHIRVNAAYAIIHIGDENSRSQLRELIDTSSEVDPDAELKGCGLLATWPGILSTNELLRALIPTRTNFYGAYRSFLYRDPIQHVPPDDLPIALEWANHQSNQNAVPRDIDNLIASIMRRAWQHLDDPQVLNGFKAVALTRIRHADPILDPRSLSHQPDDAELIRNNVDRRRLVLAAIMESADDQDVRRLVWSELVDFQDARWLIGQYQTGSNAKNERWASLIRYTLRPEDRDSVEWVLNLCEVDVILKNFVAPLFEAVPIDTEAAKRHRELKQRRQQEHVIQYLPSERVAFHLKQFQSGDKSAWWRINHVLLEQGDTHYGNVYESDLTSLPGWSNASIEFRDALISAANQYICEVIPDPDQWVALDMIYPPDWAGFRAFRLLWAEAPTNLANLPPEVWTQWAPVIIAYPTLSPNEQDAPHQHLVAHSYCIAPEKLVSTLNRLIDAELRKEHGSVDWLLWRMAECWDERLAEFLLDKAQERDVPPIIMGQLLEALLEHDIKDAVSVSLLIVRTPYSTDLSRERAIIATALLLRYAADEAWPTIWPTMYQDQAFAESVLKRIVWIDRHSGIVAAQLTVKQLADLYIWLSHQYPPAEDQLANGAVNYRMAVGDWRNNLLNELRARGTEEACQAIERIMAEFPDQEWLKWSLLDARSLTRQHSWVPPKPDEIRALASSSERRFVQNADQLLEVVAESLQRLEEKLQLAEPPAAIDIWDEVKGNTFRPKNEERLSDYLKRHLDADLRERGIIFNREVVNRRGEETDIRVEAFLTGSAGDIIGVLTVIIEVKGCWNAEMKSAMETQLAGRYLANTQTRHGLYVVGWYNCDKWDRTDWRYRQAPKHDRMEAQRLLDAQAAKLSETGVTVLSLALDTSLRH